MSFLKPPSPPETTPPSDQPLRATHPGTQERIHHAHGGEKDAHKHEHMGFCASEKDTGNAFQSNIHSKGRVDQGKHMIPPGYFGKKTQQEANFPPEGERNPSEDGEY